MNKVVFVGDKHSKNNLDARVAFLGTPSYGNLRKWIENMKINHYVMVNSEERDIPELFKYLRIKFKFVALGNKASKALNEMGIDHFKLPHPSPKNRVLNDKNRLGLLLEECKSYLVEKGRSEER